MQAVPYLCVRVCVFHTYVRMYRFIPPGPMSAGIACSMVVKFEPQVSWGLVNHICMCVHSYISMRILTISYVRKYIRTYIHMYVLI